MDPAWPKDRKVLTTEVTRLDAAIKTDGRAKYAYDIQFPDLLYGRILRSPHAAALVKSVNLDKAKALPGVKAVALAGGESKNIRFAGQEIAAVAAISKQVADDALKLIEVDYEIRPHVVNVDAARREGAPEV